jgi:hypothetical protein
MKTGIAIAVVAVLIFGTVATLAELSARPADARAACASAPDPDDCWANAEARQMAPALADLQRQQKAAEDRAANGG